MNKNFSIYRLPQVAFKRMDTVLAILYNLALTRGSEEDSPTFSHHYDQKFVHFSISAFFFLLPVNNQNL